MLTSITDAFSLKDEVAIVTGGGTGLGFGIAQCMVDAGARVVIVGRREEPLREAVERLGPAADYRVHDITDLDSAPAFVHELEAEYERISILVNNAGIHLKKPAVETTEQEFHAMMQTHVYGAFALTRAAAPAMLDRGHGSILFIASMSSILGIPLVVAYSAAKSAYLGLVRSLSAEFSPHGVRVNGIAPGWIDTPMLRRAVDNDPARKQRILTRTPQGKFGDIRDVGWAAVYLCSPAAQFVSGAVVPVDGGASIGF